MVRRVLCYGDSNTWGFRPGRGERLAHDVRWPGVMANALTSDFAVLEDGLNGRTTVRDDPFETGRNGLASLVPSLERHRPLSLVILLLGTNDLMPKYGVATDEIAEGVGTLAETVRSSHVGPDGRAPAVLLMAPPPLADLREPDAFFAHARAKSLRLATHYRRIADRVGCPFFDTGRVITSSLTDGVHLDPAAHATLGRAVATVVESLLDGRQGDKR